MRQHTEQLEAINLSAYAQLSASSLGRDYPVEQCPMRTEFQRDRDRILHCKSFRRLKHKTQVFLSPEGDHYRTRLTHTLEVAQIARTISRCLRLNEDLTEAIALGHDIGHTPFGHAGERTLERMSHIGFTHYKQSLRVVEVLEENKGLNLTKEVRDGIYNHTKEGKPSTLEGWVVNISDRIAYINHDIDDAERAGIIKFSDIPKRSRDLLGDTSGRRINAMVWDVVQNSMDKARVSMSLAMDVVADELRDFLFQTVYVGSPAKVEEAKAEHVIEQLYLYFIKNIDLLPEEFKANIVNYGHKQVVCDYIAGMTDRYALEKYQSLFIPMPWR